VSRTRIGTTGEKDDVPSLFDALAISIVPPPKETATAAPIAAQRTRKLFDINDPKFN
jgi:hypothetical protein